MPETTAPPSPSATSRSTSRRWGDWMLPHVADRPLLDYSGARRHRGARPFSSVTPWRGGSELFHTMTIAGDRRALRVARQRRGAGGQWRRAAASSCILPTARRVPPDVPRSPWCSTSIPAPDVAFADVIAAAHTVKQVLEMLGLAAFPRPPAARACTWWCRSRRMPRSHGRRPRASPTTSAVRSSATRRPNI